MKNVVDVLSMQATRNSKSEMRKPTNYRKINNSGVLPRYLFECALKLRAKPLTSARAAMLYHSFYNKVGDEEYDKFLIAAACLYVAGKLKDDHLEIRNVINVAYNTLNRKASPLETLGEDFSKMRDSLIKAECFISRLLKFELTPEEPHKYLLYYMKTLQDWLGPTIWNSVPIARTAASYLQDFHQSPKIINHKATHIAACCLSLALQTYGVQVPLADESNDASMWYTPFVADMKKEKHWEIIEDIIEVYKIEADIDACVNSE